ncbi:MAG TPA: family 16 glycoside hydrolase [Verrucomicrobiae bacterium]|nr:family 16 glycoside hydrolase [Verrucomicrobiae bacterium]
MRHFIMGAIALLALPVFGTERVLNFGDYPLDATPSNFVSTVGGAGKPGSWKIILDDAPSAMPGRGTNSTVLTKQSVLAQLSRTQNGNHFPMLVLNDDSFNDFTFTTRFKIVAGDIAKMAGIVFRYQDEKNYYVLVASVRDSRFWFFKMVNGQRGPLIGPKVSIPENEWHQMTVQCDGNHIHCLLDGNEIIPMVTDSSFLNGKVGFWTMADSSSYFTGAKISYTPRENLAQALVNDALAKFSKLVDLKIFATRPGGAGPVIVASKESKQLGEPGGKVEKDVIANGRSYYGKDKKAGTVTLTVPLRDRNGDSVAAIAVIMKTFPGETEDTAAMRSQTIVRTIEPRVSSLEDLLQ